MNSDWVKVELGSVTELISRGVAPKYTEDSEYFVLNQKCIRNGSVSYNEAKRTDISAKAMKRAKFIKETDTLICSTGVGTLGRVGKFKNNYRSNTTVDSHVTIVRGNKNINPVFLSYNLFLRQGEIESLAEGTTGQIELPKKKLGKLIINLPPLSIQKKIAAVLSALDDKIELNNKINQNLEQQAQALFKSWFIDFEPFGGKMPEDWKKSDIYSIADITYGASFSSKLFNKEKKGLPVIRIRDLKRQYSNTYTEEIHLKAYTIKAGDIVVGMDGEFKPYIWGGDNGLLNQRVCVFHSKRYLGKLFLYFTIKPLLNKVEQTEVATTVIHIGKQDFDAFKIVLPTCNILDKFDGIAAPIYNTIVRNLLENSRLSQLRDTLLPKLMSGEIDVSSIDVFDSQVR